MQTETITTPRALLNAAVRVVPAWTVGELAAAIYVSRGDRTALAAAWDRCDAAGVEVALATTRRPVVGPILAPVAEGEVSP